MVEDGGEEEVVRKSVGLMEGLWGVTSFEGSTNEDSLSGRFNLGWRLRQRIYLGYK